MATRLAPLDPTDGYLPIEDHGLIGDGTTCALVARDGAVVWLCLPRFDSSPLFCRILDKTRGGAWTVAPEGLVESRQFYEHDSGVLVTEMRSSQGLVRLTDAFTLRNGADLTESAAAGRGELLRSVEVLNGPVRLIIAVEPRGGAGTKPRANGIRLHPAGRPDLDLQLDSSRPLMGAHTTLKLTTGERLYLVLRWGGAPHYQHRPQPEKLLEATRRAWRHWAACIEYKGPQTVLVHRSAITLKLLDHWPNGAIIAASTSSLPAPIGGMRNWDYRYTWVRDAAFSAYAFHRIGMAHEAGAFLGWALDTVEEHGRPPVLCDVHGKTPQPEWEDPELEGYRRSSPVRWGNAAVDQIQHDVYGDILDCAYQWARHRGALDGVLWDTLRAQVEAARQAWRRPDNGIWEVRSHGRLFTYSAALCQVALDRGWRLAEQFGLPADVDGWRTEAEQLRQTILDQAWDTDNGTLTEHLGGGGLDAALLSLPLRRLIAADDPRMVATTRVVSERLSAGDGLLYRYLHEDSPDGIPGGEGAFLLCSFWLVDNLAKQGRLDEALDLYDRLCARANPLGLLPEQIDPRTGAFIGNFPQAFSHVGLISSGVNLARSLRGEAR